jgi:dimethylhistidine N-methyltransferase
MNQSLIEEITSGLKSVKPFISPKFFYDDIGSHLFEAITFLDEYYPTRVEKLIMKMHESQIASAVGTCDVLLDLGAGNCAKASELFNSINPKEYLALDISKDFLELAIADLKKRFPHIQMFAQVCDLAQPLSFPELAGKKKTFFYPGSSIGNFTPDQVSSFFRNIATICDGSGGLLIGVDLVKDNDVLQKAYDDSLGITAAFNLNVLKHVNRIIASDFDVLDWEHYAFFNQEQSRIEMHLRAKRDLVVTWSSQSQSQPINFKAGEMIHTENSYKYTKASFSDLLINAGFDDVQVWTDPQELFMVCFAKA